MRTATMAFLRCPFCANSLTLKAGSQEDEVGIRFGIASCAGCESEFPIVGGVLIIAEPGQLIGVEAEAPAFRSGRGVNIATLCRLIGNRAYAEAFSRLLNPATPNADLFARPDPPGDGGRRSERAGMARPDPHRDPRIPTDLQAHLNRLSGERLLHRARRRVGRFLLENQDSLTALEAMDLYMARYSRAQTAVHFAYSFGQPRHLAALSVASVIRDRGGPILDLACGLGHLTHYFCADQVADRPVVGVDRNFFRLWVARNFVAPGGDFVCQWVDRPMPFGSRAFESAFCSDAFHLILNKAGCLRETRRVISPAGMIGLVRFGNAAVEPSEGHELTIEGYERLFSGTPHVLLGEDDLVRAYLERTVPDLTPTGPATSLAGQKWISAVLCDRDHPFSKQASPGAWPHAEGRLALNPIYVLEARTPDGGVRLRFEFPSEWYEFENAGYLKYAPDSVDVPGDVMAALQAGECTDAVQAMIDQFVILGVPDRYMPDRFH